MSIIKKINKIYIFLTIVIIIAVTSIILVYTSIFKKSDIYRTTGITNSEIRNFKNSIDNLEKEGMSFLEWINKAEKIEENYKISNVTDVLGIKGKIEGNSFDTAAILDNKGLLVSEEQYIDISTEEFNNIEKILKSLSDKENKFINCNDKVYYVFLKKLPINKKDLRLLLVKEIDDEFINIGNSEGVREIKLETGIEYSDLIDIKVTGDKKAYLHMNRKEVKAYVPIEVIGEGKEIYFTVNEKRKASLILNEFAMNVILIFVTAFCFGNYIIYRIVKDKVVNRIIKTNNEVNSIIKNNQISLLKTDSSDDEITNLSKDINKLFLNIEENNKNLLLKDRKNSRLLSAMQNLYVYIELIEDENGQVVDGIVKEMNKSAMELFGIEEELLGNKLSYYKERGKYKYYTDYTFEIFNKIKKNGESVSYKNYTLDNNLYFDININCVSDGCLSIILNEVSEINRVNNKLERIVNYDDVTGLYSKFYILEYLSRIINEEEEVFTIILDLDNFKVINDAIGHTKGDKILKILGESLRNIIDEKIIVGRIGGDEFIVVGVGDEKNARNVCSEIIRIITRRLKFNNYNYEVKATLGVSLYPSQGNDVEQLIQFADIAMHVGKTQGKNIYKIYSEEMLEDFELQGKLKEAISRGELEAYFQPIYNTISNEVIGAEALVRWKTIKEVITPDRFLESAKKNGDIVLIDDFILREACKLCKEKIEGGQKEFYIAVNISYKYFILDSFIDILKEVIEDSGIETTNLRIEITESELLRDYDNLSKKLEEVRELGVKISLDDFGVGYSAFNYIRKLPIDIVKIDKNLIESLGENSKNKYIVDMLIKLFKVLDLEVVCEGVEYKEQLEILKEIDCINIQGYYISEPLNKEKFNELTNKKI